MRAFGNLQCRYFENLDPEDMEPVLGFRNLQGARLRAIGAWGKGQFCSFGVAGPYAEKENHANVILGAIERNKAVFNPFCTLRK